MKKTIIFIDGSCEPTNPNGNVGVGIIIYEAENFTFSRSGFNKREVNSNYSSIKKVKQISKKFEFGSLGFEQTSNNMAEHIAMSTALEFIKFSPVTGEEDVVIFSDSEMVIRQMIGEYKIKSGKVYYDAAMESKKLHQELTEKGCKIQFEWIPREFNAKADELSK